ncbi:MAG: NFACT family protein [Clostridiales bacterium]|nr:NFACT family protein [Clostridiales bacterium]
MAFDGVMINALIKEIGDKTEGGKIDKIYQPERDDIVLQIRAFGSVYRLFLSANPSNPRFNLTDKKYENPKQPPLFCMVLRKHIGGGHIKKIIQPDFERVAVFEIESLNEMGDFVTYKLVLEVMGRHSNLILINDKGVILEAARHINYELSSVREVLPGKAYVKAPSQGKTDPMTLSRENFFEGVKANPNFKAQELIYKCYTGLSPLTAGEICLRGGVDPSDNCEILGEERLNSLFKAFESFMNDVKEGSFSPHIYFKNDGTPKEFAPFRLLSLEPMSFKEVSTCSELLEDFYSKRDMLFRMGQKTHDLRKLVTNNIERCVKKKDIQQRTLKSIEKREKHRLYGELLISYAYSITSGAKEAKVINFYDEEQKEITIPLDEALSVQENAAKYFKKYNKEKRTYAALQVQMKENDEELYYLESVLNSIEECKSEDDIKEIRRELFEQGFIKKHKGFEKNKKSQKKSAPMRFVSSDGFVMAVGKNNTQNDELTMKTAKNSDLWFHTKQIPGSHVVVFTEGKEVPDKTINEAAMLAAYYSKARSGSLVPVDYTPRRFVKKPNGAKPGFVIYTTNKTAFVTPTEEFVEKLSQNKEAE